MTRRIPPHLPAVLALGMVGQVGQIVFLRELLMVFHGSELSIGIILATWMVWVGVGSRLGAVLAERSRRPLRLAALASAGALVLLPATILVIRNLRGLFDVLPGAYLSFVDIAVSCFFIMAPVCLLFGALFVLLARVWREREGGRGVSGAAKTYMAEAGGNVIGGLVFTIALVHFMNSFEVMVAGGAALAGATLWSTAKGSRAPRAAGSRAALWGALVCAAIVFPFLRRADAWAYALQWRRFSPEHELVETRQSKYGTIAVARREDQYSFFQSGHLVFSTAGAETASAALEEQDGVIFAHFSLAQHPSPKRVLLLGGGFRGTLREIARHPVESVDYVELDPVLTETARRYASPSTLEALDDPRVRLAHADGRLFVKTARASYDMILVDMPDPTTAVLNRFYTEEFFREAQARLNPGGVLVIGAVSTPDMRGLAVANRNATIYHTLRSVFAEALPAGGRFVYFFASDTPGQVSAEPRALRERHVERGIAAEDFSPLHFEILLEEAPLRRKNWVIRRHGRHPDAHLERPDTGPLFPPSVAEQEREEAGLPPVARRYFVNSDAKPIGFYHTLRFWNELTRGGGERSFAWILRVEPWWIAPFAGAVLAATLALRWIGGRRGKRPDAHFAVLVAVFTTGLSTMALQVALLLSFQSVYGFVYEMVGLIMAVFMAGLVTGTAVAHRFVADKSDLRVLAAVQALVAGIAGVTAVGLAVSPGVRSPAAVFALFSAMTFAAGLVNGTGFPLATSCFMALHKRAEKATGVAYGVELFGACAGALLASVVVAPVLGMAACCLMAVAANGSAFFAVLLSRRNHAKTA